MVQNETFGIEVQGLSEYPVLSLLSGDNCVDITKQRRKTWNIYLPLVGPLF